jgi:hypothetical protein
MSESVGINRLVIRIRDDELAGPGTDHGSVPSLAVLAAITVGNVEPPLVDSSIFTFPVRLVDAHVIVCDEPMTQLSPPFGDVTVIVGWTMLKFALLVSMTVGMERLLMRILAVVLTGPPTVHASAPSFAVLANSTVGNVEPPLVDNSTITFPVRLADVHVSVCDNPIAQDSPPLGDVTVSVGCAIVKLALLLSRMLASETLTILTRAVADTGPVTVHGSVPSLAVLANSVVGNVEPPFVERSIFTFPLTPLDVHVIVCDEPIPHDSPPLGAVTVMVFP